MATNATIILSFLALVFVVSGLSKASGNEKGLSGTRDVNVKDGIVVLTDNKNQPVGFPDLRPYAPTSVNSVANFGFLNLTWNYPTPSPYGLDWGFYDVSTRKFLGRKISYFEYMTYGANNVYIGLNAFDADMEKGSQGNIVGEMVRAPQSEANKPTRYICPLYSVKVKSRSKIKVSSPPKTLSKFDTWFVNGNFFLGHDEPLYPVDPFFIMDVADMAWFHCKNLEALYIFAKNFKFCNFFWHEEDDFTLTSHNVIWTYPGKKVSKLSVLVDVDLTSGVDYDTIYGICSDYVGLIDRN